MEEDDTPKEEDAISFRNASASEEEDATSSFGASKQDNVPKEEDVSSSSGASKENDAYTSTEENASSSFSKSKRRTFRRRRTRPPLPRQSLFLGNSASNLPSIGVSNSTIPRTGGE